MGLVTIFKTFADSKTPHYLTIDQALNRIKKSKYRNLIDQIRLEIDKEQRNKLKKGLPAIAWSGKFKERNNYSLLNHSGLVCLDFDDLVDVAREKEKYKEDEYVFACFISPSGNGLKVLIKVDDKIIDQNEHEEYCRSLEQTYPNYDKMKEYFKIMEDWVDTFMINV